MATQLKPTAATPPDWQSLVNDARMLLADREQWAKSAILLLRDDAKVLSAPTRSCDWRTNRAIADACDWFLDCPCLECLDEIEALMDPGPRDELGLTRRWFVDRPDPLDVAGEDTRSFYGMGGC